MPKSVDDKKKILLRLRDIRREKGFSISSLAEKSGLDYQKIGRMERGETKVTLGTLQRLADVMQIPIQQLLEDSGNQRLENNSSDGTMDHSSLDLIPMLFNKFDNLFTKHNISMDTSSKVYLATEIFKGIKDIRTIGKDEEDLAQALFRVLDAIFERLELKNWSDENDK